MHARLTAISIAAVLGSAPTAHATSCISIFTPEDGKLGFRNTCDKCRVAVWAWGAGQSNFSIDGELHSVWQGGDTVTRKYRIYGRSELRVEEEEAVGKLVREESCGKQ